MRELILALVFLLAQAAPASAHRLKLFATVEDGAITGYAFFVGGGRPRGATLVITGRTGVEAYRGTTDAQGSFSWRPPAPDDFRVAVDAGDGHGATATIAADRFGSAPLPATAATMAAAAPAAANAGTTTACGPSSEELAALVDRAVDRAVSRQTRPLLEAFEAADDRVRLNDVAGGLGAIFGLAGVGMWVASRRRGGAGDRADAAP